MSEGELGSVARSRFASLWLPRHSPTWLRSEGAWRRRTLRAIQLAAAPGLFVGSSRTDGLRAVRMFEHINGVAVDPADAAHRAIITNTGWHFALRRRLNKGGVR